VQVADVASISRVATGISPTAHRLLAAFAPGPMTLVLWTRPDLPRNFTAGLDTVAVRLPARPVARKRLQARGPVLLWTYADVADYGRRLYARFAASDGAGAAAVLAHLPPAEGLGLALRDRLQRASGV
jgi:hypothetical protein